MIDNKNEIKLVIITGDSFRHKWFARFLSEQFDVRGILFEEKRSSASKEASTDIVLDHIEKRDKAEKQYFDKDYSELLKAHNVREIEKGQSNSVEIFDWIKNIDPDIIVLFGSSVIRDPLLSFYDKRIINIHLGLSPYYRGTATNFWPMAHAKPECVGATIHLAVEKVDAGAILAQARPDIEEGDTVHDIGCKTIIAGAKAMARAVEAYVNKQTKGIIQTKEELKNSVLCKRDDFNEQAVKEMLSKFEQGMIKDYLDNKKIRDVKYPIVELDN